MSDEAFRAKFLLVHYNGDTHAQFATANAALACLRGLEGDVDPRVTSWFHFEDAYGHRVTLHEQRARPGHAYALIEGREGDA